MSILLRPDAWFLLGILLLGMLTIIVLVNVTSATRGKPSTASISVTQSPSVPPSVSIAAGVFREYPLPQSDSQVMRLAIDHEGRVWFGEMGRNYLGVFDPRTQTFEQMTPPHGRYGMMGMLVAPDDTIWFAEQYANYIGHYFPTWRKWRTVSLTVACPSCYHIIN